MINSIFAYTVANLDNGIDIKSAKTLWGKLTRNGGVSSGIKKSRCKIQQDIFKRFIAIQLRF